MDPLTSFAVAVKNAAAIGKTVFQTYEKAQRESLQIQFNESLLDIGTKALDVQALYTGSLDKIKELQNQLAAYDKWETEKTRYTLKNVGLAAFVYALKESEAGNDPPHWLCSKCYNDRTKSILQLECGDRPTGFRHQCPVCRTMITVCEDIDFA